MRDSATTPYNYLGLREAARRRLRFALDIAPVLAGIERRGVRDNRAIAEELTRLGVVPELARPAWTVSAVAQLRHRVREALAVTEQARVLMDELARRRRHAETA
jgi:hypothetical protein